MNPNCLDSCNTATQLRIIAAQFSSSFLSFPRRDFHLFGIPLFFFSCGLFTFYRYVRSRGGRAARRVIPDNWNWLGLSNALLTHAEYIYEIEFNLVESQLTPARRYNRLDTLRTGGRMSCPPNVPSLKRVYNIFLPKIFDVQIIITCFYFFILFFIYTWTIHIRPIRKILKWWIQ